MIKRHNKWASKSYREALGIVDMNATSGKHEARPVSNGCVRSGQDCGGLPDVVNHWRR